MALQPFGGSVWFPDSAPANVGGAPGFSTTNLAMTAASDKVAFLPIVAPKTGNIRKVFFRTVTVTTGDTVDVRLETVDATTGRPTGTLFGTTTNGAQVIASADDNVVLTTTLTADAAVTAGASKFAVVIVNGSLPGNLQIAGFADQTSGVQGLYSAAFASAAWTKIAMAPVVGLEYSDGSYAPVPGVSPYSAINTHTFSNSSTPDVYALKFQVPFPTKALHWWLWLDLDGDATVKLYDSDGVTVMGSTAIDKDEQLASSSGGIYHGRLSAEATLLANTYYYLGFEPSSATNTTIYSFNVPTDAAMDALPGGQVVHYATAKDPSGVGSWTATTTRRLFGGIGLSAFSDGIGAGGAVLVHPGMTGGLNG